MREWEYTCTAGISFMGIGRARRFDILIWFDWLGLGGFFYFLKCARFFMCFYFFLGFFIFRKSRRACFAVNVDLSFHGTHRNVWAKNGRATILVTIYSRKNLKRWSKNGKFTNLLFIIGHINCDKICNNYYSPNITLMDNIYMSFFLKVHLVRGVKT